MRANVAHTQPSSSAQGRFSFLPFLCVWLSPAQRSQALTVLHVFAALNHCCLGASYHCRPPCPTVWVPRPGSGAPALSCSPLPTVRDPWPHTEAILALDPQASSPSSNICTGCPPHWAWLWFCSPPGPLVTLPSPMMGFPLFTVVSWETLSPTGSAWLPLLQSHWASLGMFVVCSASWAMGWALSWFL